VAQHDVMIYGASGGIKSLPWHHFCTQHDPPIMMEILSHPDDDEQTVVFETEMVTPVCLFPAVPSTATSVSDSVYDSDCGLGSYIVPRLLVDEEPDDDNGKDVLIDVPTSFDTSHDAQTFLYHAYSIPLATLQGHYNTVHLLPPANGPPTLPGLARHLTNGIIDGGCWHPLNDGSWCGPAASFVLNWQDKLHEFDKPSDARNHFLDEWKLTMLQNAVHLLAKFCQVKLIAGQHKVAGVALMFEDYFKLLSSAAVNYDELFMYKKTAQWSVFACP
jgi:hypothetical protein